VLQAHGGDLLPVDEDLAESDLRPRGDPRLAVGQLVHRRRMPAAVPPWASISTSQFQPYRAGWVTGPPRLASNTVAMTTAVATKTDPARTPRGTGRVAGLDRTVSGRLAELLRTGRSERLRLRDRSTTDPQIFGVRRGATSCLTRNSVTLGHRQVVTCTRGWDTWVPEPVGQGGQGPLASPTETPQRRDTAADPHRNPTDETAHSGTLVMRVKKHGKQSSAAPMRVS
jgi:hypothetical protein